LFITELVFQDVSKEKNPLVIAGIFIHRRQLKSSFISMMSLLRQALLSIGEDLAGVPYVSSDGCHVFGPVLEGEFKLCFHGVCRNHVEKNISRQILYDTKLQTKGKGKLKRDIFNFLRTKLYTCDTIISASAAWDDFATKLATRSPSTAKYLSKCKRALLLFTLTAAARRDVMTKQDGTIDTPLNNVSEASHMVIDRRYNFTAKQRKPGLHNVLEGFETYVSEIMLKLQESRTNPSSADWKFKSEFKFLECDSVAVSRGGLTVSGVVSRKELSKAAGRPIAANQRSFRQATVADQEWDRESEATGDECKPGFESDMVEPSAQDLDEADWSDEEHSDHEKEAEDQVVERSANPLKTVRSLPKFMQAVGDEVVEMLVTPRVANKPATALIQTREQATDMVWGAQVRVAKYFRHGTDTSTSSCSSSASAPSSSSSSSSFSASSSSSSSSSSPSAAAQRSMSTWTVGSRVNETIHTVRFANGKWTCTCNARPTSVCPHRLGVLMMRHLIEPSDFSLADLRAVLLDAFTPMVAQHMNKAARKTLTDPKAGKSLKEFGGKNQQPSEDKPDASASQSRKRPTNPAHTDNGVESVNASEPPKKKNKQVTKADERASKFQPRPTDPANSGNNGGPGSIVSENRTLSPASPHSHRSIGIGASAVVTSVAASLGAVVPRAVGKWKCTSGACNGKKKYQTAAMRCTLCGETRPAEKSCPTHGALAPGANFCGECPSAPAVQQSAPTGQSAKSSPAQSPAPKRAAQEKSDHKTGTAAVKTTVRALSRCHGREQKSPRSKRDMTSFKVAVIKMGGVKLRRCDGDACPRGGHVATVGETAVVIKTTKKQITSPATGKPMLVDHELTYYDGCVPAQASKSNTSFSDDNFKDGAARTNAKELYESLPTYAKF